MVKTYPCYHWWCDAKMNLPTSWTRGVEGLDFVVTSESVASGHLSYGIGMHAV